MRSLIENREQKEGSCGYCPEGLYGPKTGESISEILELGTRDVIKHRKNESYEEKERYSLHMQEKFFLVQGVEHLMGEKAL